MVEVGRSWEAEDEGPLIVTSRRVVFAGSRRTVDVPYAKPLGMEVFSDGIQIHATCRASPPTFRLEDGPMVTAAASAAGQQDA